MESKHKLSINQWAPEDRPREKMMEKGAAALSDAELLAILIGSGNTEESAVELMRRLLLSCDNNLNSLAKWEVCDYSRFKGMGPAKSITVMAALELGKRRKLQNTKERPQITCSKDIYDIFQPLIMDHSYLGGSLQQCFPKDGAYIGVCSIYSTGTDTHLINQFRCLI